MFQIKNVTIENIQDNRILLKDFSLILNEGDKAAVIGEEGNGKSTLLKWIHDESLVSSYAEVSGEKLTRNKTTGYLPQQLPIQERNKTVYTFLNENDLLLETGWEIVNETAMQMFLHTDLIYSEQRMDELSGGEKVKVQLFRIRLENPDVLLLDEPGNDLDIETLEWLEQMILHTQKPVLFISHDEAMLEKTANRIIHIEQLKKKQECRHTIANVNYQTYVRQRNLSFAKQAQQAAGDKREDEKRMERYRRIEQRVNHELHHVSRQDPHGGQLLKKKMKAVKSMGKRFERQRENMTMMPEKEESILFFFENTYLPEDKIILNLQMSPFMIADKKLCDMVNLQVFGQDKICIIGKNGSGKTTLMKEIYHSLKDREDIHIGYMPQNYRDLMDMEMTPVEYLSDGTKEMTTKGMTYLGAMKYTSDEMLHRMEDLSSGQQAKLFFLKMNLESCDVLLLDEPTRNFSSLSSPVIRHVLKEFHGCIISVSHDRKYIEEVAETVYVLSETGFVKK